MTVRYGIAVDIGGTFTDVVLIRSDGQVWTDKTLTTHDNLLSGFFRATELVFEKANISFEDVNDVVAHATTIVTNALIERKGFPTALITTDGFRDVLYIRDEHRYDMFDPQIEYPPPLILRDATWAVGERTYADGTVGKKINVAEARNIAKEMQDKGIKSVAVCLLNSYLVPDNERALREIINEVAPDIYVTLSSDVAPQLREYLRTSTAALNAYTVPITRPYLDGLIHELRARKVKQQPLIMLSNGGVVGANVAGSFPVRMIESGPAAGALVASYFAGKHNIENLMSFDMGGTTAKACLIQDAKPLIIGDFEVDRRYRFKPGSGMPITIPSIDMIEIGAGGGSIARVDALGLLKVGPDSAGSDPGPACYGRGGEDPCVTDADVALGILDPNNFLGGDMKLDAEASRAALQRLGDRLNTSIEDTAFGIFSVVGESMAAATRAHATDRGVNYRGLPLLAFGGAGPVHACYVAERLDSTRVIYPPMASVLSAFGTLITPVRLDLVRSAVTQLDDIDWNIIDERISEMLDEGQSALVEAGVDESAVAHGFAIDMRYIGQQNEVTVALERDPRTDRNISELRRGFERGYETLYGVRLDDIGVEIVNLRVTASSIEVGRDAKHELSSVTAAPKTHRPVYFEGAPVSVPVYDRKSLALGQTIEGPVIIEERETTVFVLPNWTLSVHEDGSLIADRKE